VIYTADQNVLNRTELFFVDLAHPGVSTQLNAPLPAERDVVDFAVSPDGTRVVYRADQDTDGVDELYLVNVAMPGTAVKVSAPLAGGGTVRSGYAFSPDGTRILYRADQDEAGTTELYIVDVDHPGVATRVNPALVDGGDVVAAFEFSPDGSTIVYIADQDVDEVMELFAVSLDALGTSVKLNGALMDGGDVCRFEVSPDSTRVAYCADQDADETLELYAVELASPGQSVKLNPQLINGGSITGKFDFAPDGSFIAYSASQDSADRVDLYAVELDVPGIAQKLNAPLTANGNVISFDVHPQGGHVAYFANQDDVNLYELYTVDLTSPGMATKLSAPITGGSGLLSASYTPAGEKIVYVASQESSIVQLYIVDLLSPGIPARLNGPLVQGGEVWDFVL
jgi:Tol biopolymer transport system component